MLEGLFSARSSSFALCPAESDLQRRSCPGLGRGWERQEGETESRVFMLQLRYLFDTDSQNSKPLDTPILKCSHPYLNVSTQARSRREIELYFCVDGVVDNENRPGLGSLAPRLWNCDSVSFAWSPLVCFYPCLVGLLSREVTFSLIDGNGGIVPSTSCSGVGSSQELSLPE